MRFPEEKSIGGEDRSPAFRHLTEEKYSRTAEVTSEASRKSHESGVMEA